MLGWTVAELAERAGIGYSTILRVEAVNGIGGIRAINLYAIQQALEAGGVTFLTAGETRQGGDGVRLRQ